MSYIQMNNEVSSYMNSITADKLTINMIIPTIKNSYLKGAEDMDDKWRNAIIKYKENHKDEEYVKKIFFEILEYLNEKQY